MDYATQIRQLTDARTGCETTIKSLEAASLKDGADRSNSLALLRRDMASYDRQLAGIEKQLSSSPAPEPPAKKEKSPK